MASVRDLILPPPFFSSCYACTKVKATEEDVLFTASVNGIRGVQGGGVKSYIVYNSCYISHHRLYKTYVCGIGNETFCK